MKKLPATEAKLHFGELLDMIERAPVVIQRSGRDKAVVLSMRDFEEMSENKYWGEKALKAEKKGKYISKKASENLLKIARSKAGKRRPKKTSA